MLTLNRNGHLVEWAWKWSDYESPRQTDLCTLFWRTVFLTPLKIAATGFLGGVFTIFLGYPFVMCGIVDGLLLYGVFLAMLAIVLGSGWVALDKGSVVHRTGSAVYKAIKHRYCPLITLEG